MIRLFSSIRKTLINEGKTSRYVRYAVGEVLLIMVGILLALQIQNWNEGRKERLEARESLIQVKQELEQHVSIIPMWIGLILETRQSLEGVQSHFDGVPIEDPFEFLSTVARGADTAWGQAALPRTTYDELISSGKFSLINKRQLRHEIATYYRFAVQSRERATARIADFGKLAYELVPRESEILDFLSEDKVKTGLSGDRYRALAGAVLESDLERHIIPLQNRYQLIQATWAIASERATELIAKIETELNN